MILDIQSSCWTFMKWRSHTFKIWVTDVLSSSSWQEWGKLSAAAKRTLSPGVCSDIRTPRQGWDRAQKTSGLEQFAALLWPFFLVTLHQSPILMVPANISCSIRTQVTVLTLKKFHETLPAAVRWFPASFSFLSNRCSLKLFLKKF